MNTKVHHKKRVASNSIYLFILTFSNYFLYFLTIPYQTRVLGPESFGLIGFAIALTAYFKIVVDFGFMISATEQVSLHRDNKAKVSKILSNTIYAKLLLTAVAGIILTALCMTVPLFRDNALLFFLFFLANTVKSFQPDFVYRGIERMKAITIRTVLVQVFFMVFLFIIIKSPADILWIPALELIGSFIALLFVFKHMSGLGFRLTKSKTTEVLGAIKESAWFFYSRAAANIYTATNIFVLGVVYGAASQVVGMFTTADRLVSAGKQAVIPVGDALYPHMVRKKDFRMMKAVLIYGTIVMAIGCTIVAFLANDISAVIFGEDYRGAGDYLRILSLSVFFAFPGILLGFPTMSPMGLAKQANISNIIAAVLQIIQIAVLAATGGLSVIAICIATCITEFVAVAYRALIVFKYRDRLRLQP